MNKNKPLSVAIRLLSLCLFCIPLHSLASSEFAGVYGGTFSATFDNGEFAMYVDAHGKMTVMGYDTIDEEGYKGEDIPVADDGSFNFDTNLGDSVVGLFTPTGVSGTYTGPDGPGTFAGVKSPPSGFFEIAGGLYEGTMSGSFVDEGTAGTFAGDLTVTVDAVGSGFMYADVNLFVGGVFQENVQIGALVSVDPAGNVTGTLPDNVAVAGTMNTNAFTGTGTFLEPPPDTVNGTWNISRVGVLYKPINALAVLADANGNTAPEFAALVFDKNTLSYNVHVKDSSTGDVVRVIDFGQIKAVAMDVAPDQNGNGVDEIVVLGIESITSIRAQVRDGLTGDLLRSISFAAQFVPVAIGVIPNVDGAGAVGVVVLGVNASGDVRAQIKNALTGALITTVQFATNFPPKFMGVVPDVTGDGIPELAVLGIDVIGTVRVQLKDITTGMRIRWIQYARSFPPLDMKVVPNADGTGAPAISVLGKNTTTGRVRVQTKYAATGTLVGATGFVFFSPTYEFRFFTVVRDVSGNNADELAYLGVNVTGTVRVQVKDTFLASLIRQVFFAQTFPPKGFASGESANGNNTDDLFVLGKNANGVHRVQVKDPLTASQIGTYFVP